MQIALVPLGRPKGKETLVAAEDSLLEGLVVDLDAPGLIHVLLLALIVQVKHVIW